jgi:hypothetical protein
LTEWFVLFLNNARVLSIFLWLKLFEWSLIKVKAFWFDYIIKITLKNFLYGKLVFHSIIFLIRLDTNASIDMFLYIKLRQNIAILFLSRMTLLLFFSRKFIFSFPLGLWKFSRQYSWLDKLIFSAIDKTIFSISWLQRVSFVKFFYAMFACTGWEFTETVICFYLFVWWFFILPQTFLETELEISVVRLFDHRIFVT